MVYKAIIRFVLLVSSKCTCLSIECSFLCILFGKRCALRERESPTRSSCKCQNWGGKKLKVGDRFFWFTRLKTFFQPSFPSGLEWESICYLHRLTDPSLLIFIIASNHLFWASASGPSLPCDPSSTPQNLAPCQHPKKSRLQRHQKQPARGER